MRVSAILAGVLFGFQTAALGHERTNIRELSSKVEAIRARKTAFAKRDVDLEELYTEHNLSVPLDFFPNESRYEPHLNATFNLRYFFDAQYYKPGGPIFVLLSGETSAVNRLDFLQKGIVNQVAKATNGIGVILEHRYYGTSFPFPNVTTENLRFLSTEQSLAEIDYFARNVKFEGLDADLTAPKTPWVIYGGSYAGAQAAFLQVAYPDTFLGTISSSGVTAAIYDYWEYFEPIRLHAPPDCVFGTQTLIDVVDGILIRQNNTDLSKTLKTAFGLGDIADNSDFTYNLGGIPGWQSTNWDPELNSPTTFNYCNNISTVLLYPELESQRPTVTKLVIAAGYPPNDTATENIILNQIAYVNTTVVSGWRRSGQTQDQYFTQLNATFWQQIDLESAEGYRSWYYQVCTEYGYIQTGNTPPSIKPIISRTQTLEYLTFFCRAGYNITTPPDTDKVNKYGAFDIEAPHLAIIGGNADPWKMATPLKYGPQTRNSTTENPWYEIAHGVHHWEENGVFANETTPTVPPYQVIYAQQLLKNSVVDWLKVRR
ncbi:hypothetical protein P280DRAFT_170756 [Massarina eburnea CBS 473.64]|uniref:Peptidase S28 n=1 Tax=Massarina eburnea CBS 473.64 TaxID=1395130 RepID=A0A6A6SCE7_9PLEO|nr:hypothetical protein P280DRAFT_170756 [Massarina eburnea CBS 473.64]